MAASLISQPPLIVPIEDLLPEGRQRGEVEGGCRHDGSLSSSPSRS